MIKKHEVVITGVGIISALGTNRHETVAAVCRGQQPFSPVTLWGRSGFKSNIVAQVPEVNFEQRLGPKWHRRTSRTDRLALWSAHDALGQAGITPHHALRQHMAIFVGASSGGMLEAENELQRGQFSLRTLANQPVWATTTSLGKYFNLGGPRHTVMTACSSATHAMGIAWQRITQGDIHVALVGGSESLCRLTLAGFGSLGVLDPKGTRPFCDERRGITLGEGAAFFVLERRDDAIQRGATPLGILAGYGSSTDAHHMVHPPKDGAGAIRAISSALNGAGIAPGDVDYVNAHGTGTLHNDAAEARALTSVFRHGVAIASSKSMIGHTLGASGAIEAALTILGMQHDFLPPTAGTQIPMKALAHLRLVRCAGTKAPRVAVSSSFAFGGNNAAIVLLHPQHTRSMRSSNRSQRVMVQSVGVWDERGCVTDVASLVHPNRTHAIPTSTPSDILGAKTVRRMDPLSAHVTALAHRLAGNTSIDAIYSGTSFGALEKTIAFMHRGFEKGMGLVNPLDFPNLVHSAAAGYTAIACGAISGSVTTCHSALAGDDALHLAFDDVRSHRVMHVMCCGAELPSAHIDQAFKGLSKILGHFYTSPKAITAGVRLGVSSADALAEIAGCVALGPAQKTGPACQKICDDLGITRVDVVLHRGPKIDCGIWVDRFYQLEENLYGAGGPMAVAMGSSMIALDLANTVLVTATTPQDGSTITLLRKPEQA